MRSSGHTADMQPMPQSYVLLDPNSEAVALATALHPYPRYRPCPTSQSGMRHLPLQPQCRYKDTFNCLRKQGIKVIIRIRSMSYE